MKALLREMRHDWRISAMLALCTLMILFLFPSTAYADDCGRDPLNAADCMRTGGFRQGITVVVGGAATAGVILSNILTTTAGSLPGPGVQPVEIPLAPPSDSPVAPPQGPEVLPPGMDEWQRKWLERGWRWSEEEGGFMPRPGAVSEEGKIWYRPPWDQGGEYWVDQDTYNDIEQHLRDGEEWSDTWGWQRPDENRRMDAEREQRWREFTDPEAGRRRHAQLMRDVRRDVENDPEYQRVMQELNAIRDRLKDIERKSLQDDINFHSRMAEIYERHDRNLAIVEAPVKVVKWTADTSIDILGAIPGAPTKIKYAYKATTNFIDKSITTGSYTEGLKAAVVETGKDYIADKIGDRMIKTPKFDLPESAKKISVRTLFKKQGLPTTRKLGANWVKGKIIGEGVNQAVPQDLITSPKSPGAG